MFRFLGIFVPERRNFATITHLKLVVNRITAAPSNLAFIPVDLVKILPGIGLKEKSLLLLPAIMIAEWRPLFFCPPLANLNERSTHYTSQWLELCNETN